MSTFFNSFQDTIKEGNHFLLQLLLSVLGGAKNIEQTKLIDFDSLTALIGPTVRNLSLQRKLLFAGATEEMLKQLRLFNVKLVNASSCIDFYYDPHTKHYTGAEKILKGWCPPVHGIRKVLHMDFIHTNTGFPVFVNHVDNFYDLRERFSETIAEFAMILETPQGRALTFIVDRAIFKKSLFQNIADSPHHIITWEKGYKKGQPGTDQKLSGEFLMKKYRNNSHDVLFYKFRFVDRKWSKDETMRQLIVLATNPKQKTIEVSILTDDHERAAQEIIHLMFSRWIQENDFKYLNTHFGINEITSYQFINYNKLATQISDKSIKSGEYKAFEVEQRKLNNQLAKLLLLDNRQKSMKKKREEELKSLEQELEKMTTKTSRKEISGHIKSLRKKMQKDSLSLEKRQDEIVRLTKKYEDLIQNKALVHKEVSRLQTLIEQEYATFDKRSKALMDMVKIIARNMFYQMLLPFKETYNNYRDDHVIMRNLSHGQGIISFGEHVVNVTILPTMRYQTKIRKLMEQFLNTINQQQPIMPDGSGRKIRFSLGKRSKTLFSVNI